MADEKNRKRVTKLYFTDSKSVDGKTNEKEKNIFKPTTVRKNEHRMLKTDKYRFEKIEDDGNGKKSWLQRLGIRWQNFIFLTIAGFVNAVGVTMFLTPFKIIDGGFSGTSFLIFSMTDIPMFIWLLVLNIPFFLFAWKKMGISVIVYSIYAIGIYSLATFIFQDLFWSNSIIVEGTSPIIKEIQHIILAAIFGGLVSGIGSGLTIRFGGAMDGVEVMGVMFAKKLGVTVGQFVMGYNIVIYILAGILLNDFTLPLYSVLAYAVGLKAVDFIVEGLDKAKAAMIITEHNEEVARAISEKMSCGITLLPVKGYFSRTEKVMLYCVVNRFEVSALKKTIEEIDPRAFVSISEVTDMMATQTVKFKPKMFKKARVKGHISKIAKSTIHLPDVQEIGDIIEQAENAQLRLDLTALDFNKDDEK